MAVLSLGGDGLVQHVAGVIFAAMMLGGYPGVRKTAAVRQRGGGDPQAARTVS